MTTADGTTIAFRTLGSGPGLIVVGGSLADAEDYLRFASSLAGSFTVHVMDRRGRGRSGPQLPDHSIAVEVSDLLALQRATGAATAFGHSFGGLVCLEAARDSVAFTRIALYEPGVSIGGPPATGWLPGYRRLLAAGDTRGAFATMVRGAGQASAPLRLMPLWYSRVILRLVVRGNRWRRMEPLLVATATEHELLGSVRDSPGRYAEIGAEVLILVGGKSPAFAGRDLLAALSATIPGSSGEVLDGLGHLAPTDHGAQAVARKVLHGLAKGSDDGDGAPTSPTAGG
jgi:pimeloyl-ACP methyl ester carboxylesterase